MNLAFCGPKWPIFRLFFARFINRNCQKTAKMALFGIFFFKIHIWKKIGLEGREELTFTSKQGGSSK